MPNKDRVTTMKTNARDSDATFLKPRLWIMLESIHCLPDFILSLSNIPQMLLYIYNSFCKSSYKKAFLTSSWSKGHDKLTSRE